MNTATLKMPSLNSFSSAQRTLLLILALSLLPIGIGAGLYFLGWQPGKTSNHGTLITPPVPVDLDGLKGKWSLLLVGDAGDGAMPSASTSCAACAWCWPRNGSAPSTCTSTRRPAALADLPAGTVVIVDPNGLAMMRYAPGADAKGIRADLERLLKYSWIG